MPHAHGSAIIKVAQALIVDLIGTQLIDLGQLENRKSDPPSVTNLPKHPAFTRTILTAVNRACNNGNSRGSCEAPQGR